MLRKIFFGVLFGLVLAGCGAGYQLLRQDIAALKEQADTYALLTAQNQLALGKLLEEHHFLGEQVVIETCKPRVF